VCRNRFKKRKSSQGQFKKRPAKQEQRNAKKGEKSCRKALLDSSFLPFTILLRFHSRVFLRDLLLKLLVGWSLDSVCSDSLTSLSIGCWCLWRHTPSPIFPFPFLSFNSSFSSLFSSSKTTELSSYSEEISEGSGENKFLRFNLFSSSSSFWMSRGSSSFSSSSFWITWGSSSSSSSFSSVWTTWGEFSDRFSSHNSPSEWVGDEESNKKMKNFYFWPYQV